MPAVSVVVATRDRASLLRRLVAALEAQEGAPPFEVVVVDDGSTDGTAALLGELAGSTSLALHWRSLPANAGPAAARNAGWRDAVGTLVAFTDDDCVPAAGWLAALAAAAEHADVVQGRTVADPAHGGHRGWFDHTVEVDGERGWYETCNIAYRRDWLDRVGGFDEAFHLGSRSGGSGPMWGEDTDLAWRVREAGGTTAFAVDAVVVHDVRTTTAADRFRSLRRRAGVVPLVKRHPGVRAGFGGGWWFQAEHPGALLLAAGALALAARPNRRRRWALAAVAALPWLRRRAPGAPPALLPQMLAFDLGEVAVLAAGSVRHRTLVL